MFKRICTMALIFGALAAAPPTPGIAQVACGYRSDIVAALAGKYGESQRGVGIQSPTSVFEVWASAKSGTWTILMTRPDGTSCLMANGVGWGQPVANPDPPGETS